MGLINSAYMARHLIPMADLAQFADTFYGPLCTGRSRSLGFWGQYMLLARRSCKLDSLAGPCSEFV